MIDNHEELLKRKIQIAQTLSRGCHIFEEVERVFIQQGYAMDDLTRLHKSRDIDASSDFSDSEFDAIDKFATQLRVLFESKEYQTLINILNKYDR